MRLLTAGSLVRVQLGEPSWPIGQAVKTPPFHGGNRGSNPLWVTTSEQSSLCSVFLSQEKHPPASLLLLYPKRPRLLRLCPCKRGHNASAALSTFWEPCGCRMELRISKLFTLPTSQRTPLLSKRPLDERAFFIRSVAAPYRKKARSARLLGCKHPRDGSRSLPPFCECACGAKDI